MENSIDLNGISFKEGLITRDDVFRLVSQEAVYAHYIGCSIDEISNKMCSPFRNDSIPSFSIYPYKNDPNTLLFHDFANKASGDIVVFVMKLFGIGYERALNKIVYDMGVSGLNSNNYNEKKILDELPKLREKKTISIAVKSRQWNLLDQNYWKQFGIRKSTLEKFNVVPVIYVFYNDTPVKTEEVAYAYKEWKDGALTYKIYQPLSPNKKFKWINNANYTVHQGYTQLPQTGDILIITKSLKDVMSIHDLIGISAIGLQSESVMMKQSVMDEYKSRFKKVICLFDNDAAGVKLSKSFSETYDVPFFLMPVEPNVTDFSDLVKQKGKQEAIQIFNKLIKKLL